MQVLFTPHFRNKWLCSCIFFYEMVCEFTIAFGSFISCIRLALTFKMSKYIFNCQNNIDFEVTYYKNKNKNMTSLSSRIILNSSIIFNGLSKSKPFTKCIRQMHLLTNQISLQRFAALTSTQNPYNALNPIVYNPVRFKKNKRSIRKTEEKDEEVESDDENFESDLNEFKEGDKSDKNLAQVKVQTLRLDTVVKAGLGISKR